jgi:hypothetical protein
MFPGPQQPGAQRASNVRSDLLPLGFESFLSHQHVFRCGAVRVASSDREPALARHRQFSFASPRHQRYPDALGRRCKRLPKSLAAIFGSRRPNPAFGTAGPGDFPRRGQRACSAACAGGVKSCRRHQLGAPQFGAWRGRARCDPFRACRGRAAVSLAHRPTARRLGVAHAPCSPHRAGARRRAHRRRGARPVTGRHDLRPLARLLQRYVIARLGLWTWNWSTPLTFKDEKARQLLKGYFAAHPEQEDLRAALGHRELLPATKGSTS